MEKTLYYGLRRSLRRDRRRALRLCRRCARRIFLKLWRFLGLLIFGGCWRIARFSLRQLSDGVDRVSDTLKDTPGALTFNVKDQFPKFIKAATEWIPLPYWWAFEFAIILGFVNALCRRMS